jgi:8-oxo-dGTP pyrophosphatase MutT (NUDIX family)
MAYGGEGRFDADSVAALLVTAAGTYVLQRRDDRVGVDFPGFVGLFGGAIEEGERPEDALMRELHEELSFVPARIAPFATLIFDERPSGGWHCRRRYFEVPVSPGDIDTMHVSEGQGMDVLDCNGITQLPAVIPYDLCAILMHRRGVSG